MDREQMEEQLEMIEYLIDKLEEYRSFDCTGEADPMIGELKREAGRLRKLIDRENELDRKALCREYERSAL